MGQEPVLDELLHLVLFIAAIGFVGVGAVAILERLAGSPTPAIRRVHIAWAASVLIALVIVERLYHLVT